METKKLIFSICTAALTFGADAAGNVETPVAVAYKEGQDGFYAGLGLAVSKTGTKTETTHVSVDGVRIPGAEVLIANDSDTMFFGTCVLGWNKRLSERARLAFEGMLDIGTDPEFHRAGAEPVDDCSATITCKQNGLIPSLGLKLSYIPTSAKSTFYLKAGVALSMVKMNYIGNSEYMIAGGKIEFPGIYASKRCTKLVPIIAAGMENRFGQSDFTTRFELEYRFGVSAKCDYSVVSSNTVGHVSNGTVKVSSKDAVTLRIMAVYAL